jgi:hypothetical protein
LQGFSSPPPTPAGYLPFDTMVDLRPQQKVKIQTDLVKGSITEAGSQVNKQRAR